VLGIVHMIKIIIIIVIIIEIKVTVRPNSIMVKIQYKIILICCWYNCWVQTSSFQCHVV